MLLVVLLAVLLDLYDTLVYVDDEGLHEKLVACARVADVTPDDFGRAWHATSKDSIRGRFLSMEDRAAAALLVLSRESRSRTAATIADLERSFLRTHVHPFADTLNTLDALRRRGLRLAIVTNASASVEHVLEVCRLRDLVDDVVISSEVKVAKPHPDIYERALQRIGVAAPNACYIGDGNDEELDGAKSVGLQTILVRRSYARYGVRSSSSEAAVDATVTSLAEIPSCIDRLFGVPATGPQR